MSVPDVDGFALGSASAGLVSTISNCSWSNLDFRGVDWGSAEKAGSSSSGVEASACAVPAIATGVHAFENTIYIFALWITRICQVFETLTVTLHQHLLSTNNNGDRYVYTLLRTTLRTSFVLFMSRFGLFPNNTG